MAQHTPGPWRENEHGNLVCYPDGLEVGLLSKQLPDGELEANTRLILAAPDLLEAAKRILDRGYVSEHIEEERGDHVFLSAAIAKATA